MKFISEYNQFEYSSNMELFSDMFLSISDEFKLDVDDIWVVINTDQDNYGVNPIYKIGKIFHSPELFISSLDYNYIRGTNSIVKFRFKEACDELGITIPEKIEVYKYI